MSCLCFLPLLILSVERSLSVFFRIWKCDECSYGAGEETMKTIPQMAVALKSSSLILSVLNFVLKRALTVL